MVGAGTDYAEFNNLAMNVLTMSHENSRLLQTADLVASITTALVAGHEEFAGPLFPSVKALLRSNGGQIGGAGLKVHPDFTYRNLYHWLLGDLYYRRGMQGMRLPSIRYPFAQGAHRY